MHRVLNNKDPKLQKQYSLEQAVLAAPSLANLQEQIRESQRCMDLIRHLLPETMRTHVSAGPIDDRGWCLLVRNPTASSKLRQLVPAIQRTLAQNGRQINEIRIKVLAKP